MRILVLCCLVCLRASSAFGWDDVGHKISAYIAWDRMTPAARERAFKVLMAAPEDSHLSALYPSDSRADEVKRRELFMIASYWPDIARDPKFPVRQQKYHRGTWHYKDNFWKEADAAVVPVLNLPVAAENSIERLEFFDALLRDPGKPDAEKAIAIAWLLHIGADTHQPLHCTSRVTELEPTGDQGGNLFLLEPRDPNKTLHDNIHWYWDSIIRQSEPRVGSETDCDAKYLLRLARRIMKKHPAGEMGDLRAGQFEQWRLEGYEIATKQVYAGLKRHEAPSQKYKKWAYGVAQKRVALAGYRLAELFNKALSN